MLPAAWSIGEPAEQRVAPGLADMDHREPGDEQEPHRGEEREPLPPVADHPPEQEDERDRDQQDRQHLQRSSRRCVGFSSGCAELTPKKPPPLVPSCLMAIWLATGPLRDHLLGALERRRVRRRAASVCGTPCETSEQRRAGSRAAAARRGPSGSGRPRSCRSCRPSAPRSRAPPPRRPPCRWRRRRSSAPSAPPSG